MKNKRLLVLVGLCLLGFSCKKDITKIDDLSESDYKSKLEKMIQLKEIGPIDSSNDSTQNLGSFKELYENFRSLKIKDSTVSMVQILPSSRESSPNTIMYDKVANSTNAEIRGTDYVNYIAPVLATANVGNTMFSKVTATYTATCTIGYAWKQTSPGAPKSYVNMSSSITGSSATTPSLTYAGAGTASGSAIMSNFSGGIGQYVGNMQGNIGVDGVSFSFIIAVRGTWSFASSGSIDIPANFNNSISATENDIP